MTTEISFFVIPITGTIGCCVPVLPGTTDNPLPEQSAYERALHAGDRAHLITIGSPVRGLCLRITLGHLSRRARWHAWQPDVFLIWRGRRI